MKTRTITPRPGFVIKGRNNADEKIFINITCHSIMKKPISHASGGEISDSVMLDRYLKTLQFTLFCDNPRQATACHSRVRFEPLVIDGAIMLEGWRGGSRFWVGRCRVQGKGPGRAENRWCLFTSRTNNSKAQMPAVSEGVDRL